MDIRKRMREVVEQMSQLTNEYATLSEQFKAMAAEEMTDLELQQRIKRVIQERDRVSDQVEGARMADEIGQCESVLAAREAAERHPAQMSDEAFAAAVARHEYDRSRALPSELAEVESKLARLKHGRTP